MEKRYIFVSVLLLNDGMGKIPAKLTNERREKVWFLMLKGHNPTSIIIITEKSKQYVYDMAKGTHVLMYQRAIEGIGLALSEAWDKYNDPKVPEKQKLGYLRLTKECHESMFDMTANGVSVLALKNIIERANRLGIDHTPLEDPRPLISSSNSNNNTPFVWESETETKEKDDLDASQ